MFRRVCVRERVPPAFRAGLRERSSTQEPRWPTVEWERKEEEARRTAWSGYSSRLHGGVSGALPLRSDVIKNHQRFLMRRGCQAARAASPSVFLLLPLRAHVRYPHIFLVSLWASFSVPKRAWLPGNHYCCHGDSCVGSCCNQH